MRRALLAALLLVPGLASAQSKVFPTRAAAPWACTTATSGDGYSNSTDGKAYYCDGSTWVGLLATPGKVEIEGASSAMAAYGSDIAVNGTFTGSATGWTLGAGGGAPDWAYSSNNVTHTSGTSTLTPSTPLSITPGAMYMVDVQFATWTSGYVTVTLGGTTPNIRLSRTGGAQRTVVVATTSGNLIITPSVDLVATIDNVSVRAVTKGEPNLTLSDSPTDPYPVEFRAWAGSSNMFIGYATGWWDSGSPNAGSGGYWNTGVGWASLNQNSYGISNSCFGTDSCAVMTTGSNNTGLGFRALRLASGFSTGNTAVGIQALYGGYSAGTVINGNTAVGMNSGVYVEGEYNTCVGYGSCYDAVAADQTFDYAVALGTNALPTASNQGVIGGNNAGGGIADLYAGHGVTKVSPTAFAMHGTGGSGSNNAGSDWAATPGAGTGTAAGGDYKIQRYPSIGTGSTLQGAADGLFIRSQFKVLTPATATAFARINIAQAVAGINGWFGGTIFYTIISNTASAAIVQTYAGSVNFACTNLAGTESCAFGTVSSPADNTPTGTITAPTFDAVAGTDTIDLRMSTDSDQAETTLGVFWSLVGNGTGTITPQ